MRFSILLAVAAFAAGPAHADNPRLEREYSKAYDSCLNTGDAARGVTPAMASCIAAEHRRQDVRLNQRYGAIMAGLGPARRRELQVSERRWIAARDRKCNAAYDATGGSIDRLNGPSCFMNETIERRLWLARYR